MATDFKTAKAHALHRGGAMRHRTSFLLRAALGLLVAGTCAAQGEFVARHDKATSTITVHRAGSEQAVVTQHAQADHRPFLHPIMAPDGNGVLTENQPGHHKHQTGLYWGFTRLNGRDYFHHPEGDYWRRQRAEVVQAKGRTVEWLVVYDLLSEAGAAVLTETQRWSLTEQNGRFVLDLVWHGTAHEHVTVGKYDYGGLFLRMPWQRGIAGAATNAARQVNAAAEGQRAPWLDVGVAIDGRKDAGHIAILDHPDNDGFPQPWRVDGQLGVGPARARLGDFAIKKDETRTIQHRLVVYTGELDSLGLTEMWSRYTGRTYTSSLWGIARSEGRVAKFLPPDEAVAAMTMVDGFEVNAWAAEPMLTQPMAFCWDDRGRLWVAENRDYESRGRGFSNSGDSRIVILTDTDRDGTADERKVFLTGVPFPAAIAVGLGGLWLGAPPNLLFVPDRNGDDVADEDDIEVRLTGWGIRDRHETINSLHWGPDGWLYGCEGFATPSRVGKPVDNGRIWRAKEPFPQDVPLQGEGTAINGGVWRYHPTKDRFEVVAHGFSNPWGIDYDHKGQLFITACVIPHLWHIVPGGLYHRQGGSHFNPYVYDDIKTIVDHTHRSAHGGARVYLSDAFPPEYRGQLFMANIHEHAVLSDVLKPVGSSFVASHGSDFLQANNAQWIGFSVEIGPGGELFVLDWHDADICGASVQNKDTGRIYRITPKQSRAAEWPGRYGDLAQLDDRELVQLQLSPSAWHARRARVILQGRAANGTIAEDAHRQLRTIFAEHGNQDLRLRAMWTLHVTGGMDTAKLTTALKDPDAHVRAWAIQLLCEDSAPTAVLPQFAAMARTDPSAVVRLYLAAALQRLDRSDRWPIATGLASRQEDATDHNIPKMVWFGIEPCVPEDPDRALQLARTSTFPKLANHIARRLTAADLLAPLVEAISEDGSVRRALLEGMRNGLHGRREPREPANWAGVYQKIRSDDSVAQIAIELAQRFGDANATRELLATLADRAADTDARRRALFTLARQRHPAVRDRIEGLLEDQTLRRDAIRAVAEFEDEDLGELLLKQYPKLDKDDQLAVVQTLASRPSHGWLLTKAIDAGAVPKRDVPAYVARQLRRVVGSGFVEVWGSVEQLGGDKLAMFEKYRTLLTDDAIAKADPRKGRVIFARACAACHTVYGEGGNIGPDITGANRTDLNYLLSNILDPSEEIQDAYKMVMITTHDGRTFAGNIAAEDERQVTVRTVGQEDGVVVEKAQIASRETTPFSLMPPGLLTMLRDDEVVELIAYLRTTKQVELPDKR